MRWWVAAVVPERCGSCRRPIAIGEPLQRISLADVRRTRVRCMACADEPVPALVPTVGPIEPLTVLRRLGYLPLDEAAASEREPGCDD